MSGETPGLPASVEFHPSPAPSLKGRGEGPLVMGVLNVTPDSFSDGGRYLAPERAIGAGRAMIAEGADLIDIGGESARPGAAPVSASEEQARILPVIRILGRETAISVDTRNGATMRAALDLGATVVNDISALRHDPHAAGILAAYDCAVILMHMRGTPQTMMAMKHYENVPADVTGELAERVAWAETAGIARSRLMLDPGIGFAKGLVENLAMLRGLPALASLGLPLVVGVSRKRFLGTLAAVDDPAALGPASLAAALFAAAQGAAIVRVHDVAATVQALRVWRALLGTGMEAS